MGAPNWAEIITALATAATVALLLWDRLWRRVPELIITFERARGDHSSHFYLVCQPINWGAVIIESVVGYGVEFARPSYSSDEYGNPVVVSYSPWRKRLALDEEEVSAGSQRLASVLLAVRPVPSRWPGSRKQSITVTSLVTSPIKRRVRNKIAISINS